MNKHTPGPWKLLKNDDNEEYNVVDKDSTPRIFRGIATVPFGYSEPAETEQHANAKLIAAAPELLEAAKRALNYCINSQREVGIVDGSDEELDSTKLLRAAIAKATG